MLYLYDLHLLDSYEHFMNSFKKHFLSFKIITDSEIDGKTIETVSDFFWGGSKITADGDCSHEIKTLAPWKESYDQPRQHIKK